MIKVWFLYDSVKLFEAYLSFLFFFFFLQLFAVKQKYLKKVAFMKTLGSKST